MRIGKLKKKIENAHGNRNLFDKWTRAQFLFKQKQRRTIFSKIKLNFSSWETKMLKSQVTFESFVFEKEEKKNRK